MKLENSVRTDTINVTQIESKNETSIDTTKIKSRWNSDSCVCGKSKYVTSKQCRRCHNESKLSDNYLIRNKDNCKCGKLKYKDANVCRPCLTRFKDDTKQERRWRSYGLNPVDVRKYMESHNGCCDICNMKPDVEKGKRRKYVLDVDHCHNTNVFRGLLCPRCNRGLGTFNDDIELLQKMIHYLKRS